MNIIVIVADSLRYDHLGCNGNSWIQTPHIDAFAAEATRFTRTYSEGLPTLPTRTSYWTGRYTLPFRGWQSLEPGDLVLAEYLWDKGYTTALITDTYHMHKPGMTFGRGFDTVHFVRGQEYDAWQVLPDEAVDEEVYHKYNGDPADEALWRPRFVQYLKNISVRRSEEDYFAPQVVNKAIRWLESQAQRDRLFLWVDLFDPHEPWDPPPPFDSLYDAGYRGQTLIDPIPGAVKGYLTPEEVRNIQALYAGEVSFVDKWVGRLFEALKTQGLWDNSLILFTTDHGELLGERDCMRKARPWPYEELSRIPFTLRLPGRGEGDVVEALTQTTDLFPTICDALELAPPSGLHGQSLLPLIDGKQNSIRDWAISGFHRQSWSLRNAEWSFYLWLPGYAVRDWDPRMPNTRELYRLVDDPGETNNLAAAYPKMADELELALRRFIDQLS
jgi:arylsulfatase A-like enzyme